ncbi:MAG: hypothetical protein V4653_18680 [Pseudomonadota bacterium]
MAKAFLAFDGQPVDAYLSRAEGKVRNPYYKSNDIVDKLTYKPYVTQYNHKDGAVTKGDFIFDKLSGVPSSNGFSDGILWIGVGRPGYYSQGSLYAVGGKSSILKMFQEAVDAPEMKVTTPLRIGVYKWRNVLTASTYAVRITSGAAPKQSEGKQQFVDTDVTKLLNLSGKEITIHPAILAQHIKNIFDGKMG